MMKTRTGQIPIGFRQMGFAWMQDLGSLIDWTQQAGLEVIDLSSDHAQEFTQVLDAGLRLGSIDLPDWRGMITPDDTQRQAAMAKNIDCVRHCTSRGGQNFFMPMLPQDPNLPREQNFELMVMSFRELAPVLEETDSKLVIEGWPGPGVLCCTPENLRAFFEAVPSPALGFNYDPSHLIRMGIDHLRFLQEFGSRVYHVHGKDTHIDPDKLYIFGHEQPTTHAANPRWGGSYWRYTIPGHGQADWLAIFAQLEHLNYQGCVSIELEDLSFAGTEEGDKRGIVTGASFLASC